MKRYVFGKTYKLIGLSFLFLFATLLPQTEAQVSEGSMNMSAGKNNALILDLPDVDHGFIDKLWKKYIKPYGGRTKRSKLEWMTSESKIVGIGGSSPIDIYMQSKSSDPGASVAVWFDLGGVYLNSGDHPNRFLEAEKFIMRFAIFVAKEKTQVELLSHEKEMRRLEFLLKRLEQNYERFHRDIEVAKEKIRISEANIETNLVGQDEAKKLIELQLETLKQVREKLAGLN